MSRSLFVQLTGVLVIIAAAFFLVNPTDLLMPHDIHMMVLVSIVVIALAFSALVIAEGRGDERENVHRALAGRIAFFAGTLVMVGGIVVQTLHNNIDPWLLLALCAMITVKVAARLIVSQTH